MKESKLGLDFVKVEKARNKAKGIADQVQDFVEDYTTVAVERTLCRLMGIDGTDRDGVPLPNVVVDHLKEKGILGDGVLHFLGNALYNTGKSPVQVAQEMAAGKSDFIFKETAPAAKMQEVLQPFVDTSVARIREKRQVRESRLERLGESPKPYVYVIVATGNIYEDAVQATAAARQGADVIAVIRTTGQSLLDYVPYGATTEGFGGTYATQENFRIMRQST
jgi:beta-lysine 5,6-aminomutase alpha subunit